jgi:predicted site-specific integrase-resolvase
MSKYVLLSTWAARNYGSDAPHPRTLLRWVKAGKIQPKPERHGRDYYVSPEARYTDRPQSLWERVNADRQKAEPHNVA